MEELRTWLRKLHSWKTSQLTDWQKSPRWEEPEEVTVEDGGRIAAEDDGGGVSPKLRAEAVKASIVVCVRSCGARDRAGVTVTSQAQVQGRPTELDAGVSDLA